MTARRTLPIVYACSGYSSAAQTANHVAVELDRAEIAEMSCIAGVGGGVDALVRVARSGRPIIALDGCPLGCVQHCLANVGVQPDVQHVLSNYGIKKLRRGYDEEEAAEVFDIVVASIEKLKDQDAEEKDDDLASESVSA